MIVTFNLALEFRNTKLPQVLQPRDAAAIITNPIFIVLVLVLVLDDVVLVVAAFEVEISLVTGLRGVEVRGGGAFLELSGDGVPVIGAMTVDGAAEEELL